MLAYCAEAGETFIANVRLDRVDTNHTNVYTKIKLKFIFEKERTIEVSLHDARSLAET